MQWIAASRIIATGEVGHWFFSSVAPKQRVHNFLECHLVGRYLSCVLLVVGKRKPFRLPPLVSGFNGPALGRFPYVHHLQSLDGVVGKVLMNVVDVQAAEPRLNLQHALVAPVMGRVPDGVLIGAWEAAIEALLVEGLVVIQQPEIFAFLDSLLRQPRRGVWICHVSCCMG